MSQTKTPGAMVLVPCPFCGSKPMHYDNEYATCPKYQCPLNGLVVKNEAWNIRAEQPPAVGGEPKPVGKRLSEAEMVIGWDRKAGSVLWAAEQKPGDLYHESDVAPLLAEIGRLKALELKYNARYLADLDTFGKCQENECKLQARIAELEAKLNGAT